MQAVLGKRARKHEARNEQADTECGKHSATECTQVGPVEKLRNRDSRKRDKDQRWQSYDKNKAAEHHAASLGQHPETTGQVASDHDGEEGNNDAGTHTVQCSIPVLVSQSHLALMTSDVAAGPWIVDQSAIMWHNTVLSPELPLGLRRINLSVQELPSRTDV